MVQLLKNFTWEQIVLFIVLLALAIKGCVSFFDWLADRNKKAGLAALKPVKVEQNVQKHNKQIDELQDSIKSLIRKIDLLTESDKDDIKAFITREHHYFCYQKGWIDDYSLDCIEKRYGHYEAQGGNSFVGTLMEEIRELPRQEEKKGG